MKKIFVLIAVFVFAACLCFVYFANASDKQEEYCYEVAPEATHTCSVLANLHCGVLQEYVHTHNYHTDSTYHLEQQHMRLDKCRNKCQREYRNNGENKVSRCSAQTRDYSRTMPLAQCALNAHHPNRAQRN